ncbi:hydrolase, partial [Vibrio parahaemolyticus]|nr:hydrolase [Vibrio parahaemolyticus]
MGTSMISCSNVDTEKEPTYPDKFANTELEYKSGLGDMFEIMKAYFTTERLNPTPTIEIPVHAITARQLLEEQDDVIYRLGH